MYALKIGKLDPGVIPLLEEASIIELTGWTPEELAKQEAEKLNAYKVIWGARNAASKQERKELRSFG
jgi:hypothetical protein